MPISKIGTYFGKSPSLGARFLVFSLDHSSEFLLLGWCPHVGLPEKAIQKISHVRYVGENTQNMANFCKFLW